MKQVFYLFTLLSTLTISASISDTILMDTLSVPAKRIPRNFDEKKLVNHGILSVDQQLQNQSSIHIKSYGSGLSSVSIRGASAAQTQLYWEGISINSPLTGQYDFSLLPQNIQLTYNSGIGSVYNGIGSFGGSIHIQEQQKKKTKVLLQQSFGSFNNLKTALQVNLSQNNWNFSTQIIRNSSSNNFTYLFPDGNKRIPGKFDRFYSQQIHLKQKVRFQNRRLAGSFVYWRQLSKRHLQPTLLNISSDEWQDDRAHRAVLQLSSYLANWKIHLHSGFVQEALQYTNESIGFKGIHSSTQYSNRISVSQTNKKKIQFHFLAEHKTLLGESTSFSSRKKQNQYGLLSSLSLTPLKGLSLTIANRMEKNTLTSWQFSPILAATYLLPKTAIKIKGSAGINYRNPTFNDSYWNTSANVSLVPEKGLLKDIGIISAFNDQQQRLSFKVFHNTIEDWIQWIPSGSIWQPVNIKNVENKGIESSFENAFKIKGITFIQHVQYSLTSSTILNTQHNGDLSIGKQSIYIPYHKGNASITTNRGRLSLTYKFNYIGDRFISSDNSWYLPANYTSNIHLMIDDLKWKNTNFRTTFSIFNLFDQAYQIVAWRPMPGTHYQISLTFKILNKDE